MTDSEYLHLSRGRYQTVSAEEGVLFRVEKGRAEIYACSASREHGFHKLFLAEIQPGGWFFPPVLSGVVEYAVYAVDDAGLRRIQFSDLDGRALAEYGRTWFTHADGMDALDTAKRLRDAQSAFDAAVVARFRGDEQKNNQRLTARGRNRERVMAGALGSLAARSEEGAAAGTGLVPDSDDPIQFVIRILAGTFGMDADYQRIPADIAARMDGLTLLRKSVERAGMRLRLVTLTGGWWKTDSGVMLGYYGPERNLVALLPVNERRYRLFSLDNPGGMPVTDAVAAEIEPSAFAIYPGFPRRTLSIRETVLFLLRQTWRLDWRTILATSLLGGLIPLIMPLITESIFSDIIPLDDRRALGTVVQVMLVAGFAGATVSLVRSVACTRISMRLGTILNGALWSRLLSLPAGFFRRYPVGDLASRMGSGATLLGLFSGDMASVLFDLTFSLFSLALMFFYSWKMALAGIALWAVYLVLGIAVRHRLPGQQSEAIAAANAQSARAVELLNGLPAFRARGGEEQAFYKWSESFSRVRRAQRAIRLTGNRASVLDVIQPVVLSMAMYGIALRLTGYRDGSTPQITYAEFLAFQTLYAGFNATVTGIPGLIFSIVANRPHLDNIRPVLEALPETTDDKPDAGVLEGRVEVKNVFFSYGPESRAVLRNISLTIEPGQFAALVGPSGCGKSTLLRLLLGFEKPNQGGIYYDGLDLAGLNATSVRAQMGVVLQNGMLMSDDIRTNITGTTSLTLEDAWEAAKKVGLDRDIEDMPMRMFTGVSEGGGNISGGQRQRILIARAIVNNPRIVLFDEATSALDNTTQAIVSKSLSAMRATRICVAHRLSTIRDADVIYVMDDGCIVESGSYRDLMEKKGLFSRLAERQL